MNNLSQFVTGSILIYAFVVLLGGVMGYLKAKSKVSLLAGLGSGIALIVAWFIFRQEPIVGLALATLIALLLVIVFVIRFFRTRTFMPSGLMTIFSIGATAVFLLGLLDSSGFIK